MLPLRSRDLAFAALNGLLIGILAPFVFSNLGAFIPLSHTLFAVSLTILATLGVAIGYFLGTRVRPFFYQLAKFGLIGVSNTVIDLGLYSFFIHTTGVASGWSIAFFRAFSVTLAIINSYIWNKYWSFEKKEAADVPKEFTNFVLVSAFGLFLNVTITSLLANLIHPLGLSQTAWATIAGFIPIPIVLLWNFVGYKRLVFKK